MSIHRNNLAECKPAPDITWLFAPSKGAAPLFKDTQKRYSMVCLITPVRGDADFKEAVGPSIAELTGGTL